MGEINLSGRVGATDKNTYYDNRKSQVIHNLTRSSDQKSAFIKGHMKDSDDDVKVQGSLDMKDIQGGYAVDLNSPAQEYHRICKEAGIDRWSGPSAYEKLSKETLENILAAYQKAVGSGSMSPQESTYQIIRNALNSK